MGIWAVAVEVEAVEMEATMVVENLLVGILWEGRSDHQMGKEAGEGAAG